MTLLLPARRPYKLQQRIGQEKLMLFRRDQQKLQLNQRSQPQIQVCCKIYRYDIMSLDGESDLALMPAYLLHVPVHAITSTVADSVE